MKINILNQKGGVGKSTITTNLGYILAITGKKTLIIDIDPQAHSSIIYVQSTPQKTVKDLFKLKETEINEKNIYNHMRKLLSQRLSLYICRCYWPQNIQ